MIQDITPHIYNNAYLPEIPKGSDFVMIFTAGSEVLLKKSGNELSLIRYEDIYSIYPEKCEDMTYLFKIDDISFYMFKYSDEDFPKEYEKVSVRIFRTMQPMWHSFAAITANQLYRWYDEHKFCPKCGERVHHHDSERALYCENCKRFEYPKISPAVIVAVTNGDKIVLTKYAGRDYKKYALIAGFTEIGETLEETVKREVFEEVGLKVKNIRYYKNQPWSFSDTLLVGFFAELDGSDEIKMDKNELSVAQWVKREDMVLEDSQISLTYDMMNYFKLHL
ncbi:MAG: NAD(+) diphosphatase [Firmicutes bacterium]|nr:NAD(+) diphosphatase [Bacillota bacterium]